MLAQEYDGQLPHPCQVHRLPDGALVAGAVAEEGHRNAAVALKQDQKLEGIQAYVEDSGEGRWTVDESVELAVPVPVIAASLQARFRSRQAQPFGAKLLAAMRNQFGGHALRKAG